MITKETFVNVIHNYLDTIDSLYNFEKQLEKIFGDDSRIMMPWMHSNIEYIIGPIIKEFGENDYGLNWFFEWFDCNESVEKLKEHPTEIEDNGKVYKISSIEDYYDYLASINS